VSSIYFLLFQQKKAIEREFAVERSGAVTVQDSKKDSAPHGAY
jgi:hypothetical protein